MLTDQFGHIIQAWHNKTIVCLPSDRWRLVPKIVKQTTLIVPHLPATVVFVLKANPGFPWYKVPSLLARWHLRRSRQDGGKNSRSAGPAVFLSRVFFSPGSFLPPRGCGPAERIRSRRTPGQDPESQVKELMGARAAFRKNRNGTESLKSPPTVDVS